MLKQDSALAERITAIVRDVESSTAAELVVVVAARSDAYREVGPLAGALAGWAALAFVCWSPVDFDAAWFPVDVALVALLAGWIAGRSDRVRRALTLPSRRAARVEESARAAFLEEAVHGTRARTGVLVYVSLLEERVVLLPDEALLGRVPRARWNEVELAAHDLAGFERGLRSLGERLAAWLPPEGDNPDEIPDAPRFRS